MKKITVFCILTLTIILASNQCWSHEITHLPHEMNNPWLWEEANNIYAFSVQELNGSYVSLEKYKGFVLIIVNIAVDCTFSSSNFQELRHLLSKYFKYGLRILAFPCEQFMIQKPSMDFDYLKYFHDHHLHFHVFKTIDVNGKNASQLWKFLKREQPGNIFQFIKWNFTKFIIDVEGNVVDRFSAFDFNSALEHSIIQYL